MKGQNAPIPLPIKILQGTARPSRIKREPKAKGALTVDTPPPPDLTADEVEMWKYALEWAPADLLKRIDADMLRLWVCAKAAHIRAADQVRKTGLLAKTTNGNLIQSPFVGAMNKQAMIMLRIAQEMGFTPAARTRIGMDWTRNEQDRDPWDEVEVYR